MLYLIRALDGRKYVIHFICNISLQDGHEICFVGDEAFRQLSKIDLNADELVDQVCI